MYRADSEPYELFEFGEELHVHDHDDEHYVRMTFWLGFFKWDDAFDPTTYEPSEEVRGQPIAAVLEIREGGGVEIGWMPPTELYWHRASHCPRGGSM